MANKKISELPYINGGKISGNTLVPLVTYFSATTGDTVHTYIDDFQTYLISGLTGNTDVFVTGGTYSAGTITFTNNTGGTFNVTGVTFSGSSSVSGDYLPLSGGTVTGGTSFESGLTANTIYVTGNTFDSDTDYLVLRIQGLSVIQAGIGSGVEIQDSIGNTVFDSENKKLLDITSSSSIDWENRQLLKSDGSTISFDWENGILTGQTNVGSSTISATTYLNLPINTDVFVTGGTYSAGTSTFTNNTGGTFSVSGFVTGDTYVTGLTFNTGNYNLTIGRNDGVSFTDSLAILASDLTITGGTYDPNTGTATFTNNTGGTFNVTGFITGLTDTYVTGGTYSNGTATFTNTSGGTFNVSGFYTGDTTTITGVTSVGTGITIFDSIVDRDVKINSITGDTLEKITTSLSANTIQVGINEQNLTLWDLVVQGNRLLSGNVSYISGLTFSVSPLEYLINGTIYEITSATTVTLNSGDTTFDRIDVIFADISGNTGVLEGTPSENPEKPIVDGDTQVEVTFVLVPANSTTANINEFIIYNENSGPPTEWTFGSGGLQPTRISGDSTDTAYSGVTSIKVSGVTGVYTTFFRLTGSTELDTNQYATLQFAIKNLSANTTTSRIRLRFLSTGGTQNGNAVFMNSAGSSGYVQYSSTNTSSWQLISIPLWRFYLTNTNVQVLEVAFYPIGTGAQSRYYFDLLEFVEGTASSPPSNSWTTIKGDGATTITAPNPNATLTISGGTNIGSFISGTSTVVLNLDNNINLNGVSASTISATTYQNLPTDVNVTGGTYSAGTITFTNNTGGTFNVTGLTTGSTSTISGDYLPLSGGTVTGNTIFTSGLTANTISADTLTVTNNINTSLRYLYDISNNVTVDWQNSILQGNGPILDWGQGLIKDSGPTLSIDWMNRLLVDGVSNTVLDWQNKIMSGMTNIQSSTISATTYQNLPVTADTFTTAFTYSNNVFTISRNQGQPNLTATINTVTGLTVNGNLTVTGNTNVRAFTGTTGYISGSGQNVLTVIGSGNSTTSPIFTVQGSSGELFSVNDSLTGSLFSVNDISGLPIVEVFSDNTTLWGSYQAPSLNTTTKTSLTAGTNTIYSIPTSGYTGAFYEYTLISTGSTGARAGQIMSIWSGSTANFTETTTTDIGTTTGVTFTVAVSGSNAVLSSSATTAGWTVKTIIRSI